LKAEITCGSLSMPLLSPEFTLFRCPRAVLVPIHETSEDRRVWIRG
jgi:hypothetical protein